MGLEEIAQELYDEGKLTVANEASSGLASAAPPSHMGGARAAYDAAVARGEIAAPAHAAEPRPEPNAARGMTSAATTDPVLAKLTKSEAYTDAKHKDHQRALADVAARYRELYPQEDAAPPTAGDVGDLRRAVGVAVEVPSVYKDDWNTGEEASFLDYAIREQLPTVTVQSLLGFVVDSYVSGGGKIDDAVEAQFHPSSRIGSRRSSATSSSGSTGPTDDRDARREGRDDRGDGAGRGGDGADTAADVPARAVGRALPVVRPRRLQAPAGGLPRLGKVVVAGRGYRRSRNRTRRVDLDRLMSPSSPPTPSQQPLR